MRTRHALPALALLVPSLSLAAASLAAPQPQAQPPGREPERGGRGKRPNGMRSNRDRRENKAQGLRRVMGSLGFEDRALQDEVLRYIATEVRERALVRRKAQEIYAMLRDPGASDAQVRALLDQYEAVIQADRARRAQAEDALNDRIGFRARPRLEAMLVLFGIIGDAPGAMPAAPRPTR